MISSRVVFVALYTLVLIPVARSAGQAPPPQTSGTTTREELQKKCHVDAAKSSGSAAKMTKALACITKENERQRKTAEKEREKQKTIAELDKAMEKSLEDRGLRATPSPSSHSTLETGASTNSAVNSKLSTAMIEGATPFADITAELGAGSGGNTQLGGALSPAAPNSTDQQLTTNASGQVILDSAYNTPTACDPDWKPAAGSTNGIIAVHRDLLVPKEASDDFGYRLGRRFIIYKVSVTNTSQTLQYSVADISIDLKDILTSIGVAPNPDTGKYQRFLASGHDLSILRGVPEKGQDYDPRNMTLHILQGIGSTAAAVSGLTPFSDVMGAAVANFNGAFLQAFTGIAPDHTATQLNRLSDMAFSPNNLIDKTQTKTYAVFIPESMLLEKGEQEMFWHDPRRLLNIYPFDQVNVCVAGQLLAPAATTVAPTFSPDGGNVSSTATITLTAPSSATIYYTTNGSSPSSNSSKYTTPIPVLATNGATLTVQAFASVANQVQSQVVSRAFTTQPQAVVPTFMPVAGAVAANTSVTITSTTPGATIYFTLDGTTTPTPQSTQYTGPISVSKTETVKAIAISPSTSASNAGTAQYTVNP